MNPRRPHPFQTSDSRFAVHDSVIDGKFYVLESWWFINKHREEEDGEAMHGPYGTRGEAEAELNRRTAQ